MKLKLFSTAILSLFITGLFAQYNAEIIGKALDSTTNEIIPFANISLEQNGNIVMQTTAEDNGVFYFKPLSSGNYEIVATSVGYAKTIVNKIYVVSNEITFVNIPMKAGNELKPIIVEDYAGTYQIINPNPVVTIRAEEIKHSTGESATQIVAQTVPTVYASDGGEDGALYIAGSRADATLYVIDGVRVDGSAYVPKSAIGEINVYTGGIPAKYGDVTGGVIEITTKNYKGIY